MTGRWMSLNEAHEYDWNRAEAKRLQRTPDDIDARDRMLARCRVRCLLARMILKTETGHPVDR